MWEPGHRSCADDSTDLCNALDELSDDEKTAELLPIAVQLVYVLIRLGKVEEADKLAQEMSSSE